MSTSIPKGFLKKLEQSGNESRVKVNIISSNKDIEIDPLTLKQQKELVTSAIDGVTGILRFTTIQNDIIANTIKNENLMIYDRIPIILALRNQALGDEVKIKDKTYSITTIIDKAKGKFKFQDSRVIDIDNIILSLQIPTLKRESSIIQRCIKNIDSLRDNKDSEAVGLIYMFELVKYVKSISVDGEKLMFDDIRIGEGFKIIERLPLTFYRELATFLKQISTFEAELLKFDDDVSLEIDGSLFDITNIDS